MIIEIKVPSPGESITEVQLAEWLVEDGSNVEKDAELVMIDSDKASFAIYVEESGQVKQLAKAGDTLKVGQVICKIDTSKVHSPQSTVHKEKSEVRDQKSEVRSPKSEVRIQNSFRISPLAKRMIEENNLNVEDIIKRINKEKISKEDVLEYIEKSTVDSHQSTEEQKTNLTTQISRERRETVREKMSTLRIKLSQRLVAVKNETAMLTTFNEVNMSAIIKIRNQYKESFKQKHGVTLGMTSFFAKACAISLEEFPIVNAMIDGDEIVYNKFVDMGIAVSSPKGLIVPIIRDAQSLTLTQIELKLSELAEKTRKNRITIDELTGGTFTITNGGVFGSLLSTPILNPPQSAILGMHNIIERPVAFAGKIEIQPMMYVALSYDHRLIDGKDSVTFLVRVKELLENPNEKLIIHDEFSKIN
jgi:2-oxoglutarate dehydrogenase E2 component (dihydrolipoamide succinyltransferase)